MLEWTEEKETIQNARLKVLGVGGGGGNALNNMISEGLSSVEFIAANTDAAALDNNLAGNKIQLGEGLGAGGVPEKGRAAAEDAAARIEETLKGADMVFVTAGMGGGTGTGAAPVVARVAKDLDILTVGVVTKPFDFEGNRRMKNALDGIDELKRVVDSLIIIPNQRLLNVSGKNTSVLEAFKMADNVLFSAVRGISEIIATNALVNVDFSDVVTVMGERGMALMGSGSADGESRSVEAARNAISNPLLDDVRIEGARGILVNVTGPSSTGIQEIHDAISLITEEAHEDAEIIYGQCIDDGLGEFFRITVIATGFESFEHDVRNRFKVARAGSRARGAKKTFDYATHRLQSNDEFLNSKRRAGSRTVADKSASEYDFADPKGAKQQGTYKEDSDDEYGIPAFKRKMMD